MRTISKAIANLYGKVVELRNQRFDSKAAEIIQAKFPIISIGNLTVGGTGKTPIVQFILNYLKYKKIKTVVISRAYKASAKKPIKVDRQNLNPQIYGDEPCMLATANSGVDFYVGSSKSQIAQSLTGYQIGLVDDGFQHRRLARDLDIVILDATEEIENYQCLPLGKAREEFANLKRANIVIISKVNLALVSDVERLKKKIRHEIHQQIPIVEFEVKWDQLKHHDQCRFQSVQTVQNKKVFAFCAIGRSDIFERTVLDLKPSELDFLSYSDHHQFTKKDIDQLVEKINHIQPDLVICTEKDLIKLNKIWPDNIDLWSLQMSVMPVSDAKVFYEKIDEILSF